MAREIDAASYLVLPGGVDVHVHLPVLGDHAHLALRRNGQQHRDPGEHQPLKPRVFAFDDYKCVVVE